MADLSLPQFSHRTFRGYVTNTAEAVHPFLLLCDRTALTKQIATLMVKYTLVSGGRLTYNFFLFGVVTPLEPFSFVWAQSDVFGQFSTNVGPLSFNVSRGGPVFTVHLSRKRRCF